MDPDPEDAPYWAVPIRGDEDWEAETRYHSGYAIRHAVDLLVGNRPPDESPRDALTTLETLGRLERAIELERAIVVAQLRHEGASWSTIAVSLRATKQSAHQRYRRHSEQLALWATFQWGLDDLAERTDGYYAYYNDEFDSYVRENFGVED